MRSLEADRAAVARFLACRDEASFLALYRAHTPYLLRLALRLLGERRSEAEDAVQDTWMRAATRLGEFRGDAALRTWLAGFTINCCRERRRPGPAEPQRQAGDGAAPLCAADERVDLEQAIAELPDGYREVLVLHDLEGLTHEEIASRLGIAPGTSKSQLSRARSAVRRRLLAPAPEPSIDRTEP